MNSLDYTKGIIEQESVLYKSQSLTPTHSDTFRAPDYKHFTMQRDYGTFNVRLWNSW